MIGGLASVAIDEVAAHDNDPIHKGTPSDQNCRSGGVHVRTVAHAAADKSAERSAASRDFGLGYIESRSLGPQGVFFGNKRFPLAVASAQAIVSITRHFPRDSSNRCVHAALFRWSIESAITKFPGEFTRHQAVRIFYGAICGPDRILVRFMIFNQ